MKTEIKTILFAFLIATMIIPFSGIQIATAEVQTEKTDEEWLREYEGLFGNSTVIEEGPSIGTDADISRYAPLTSISNDTKIDSLQGVERSKLTLEEYDAFVNKQVEDRASLLQTVSMLIELRDTVEDPEQRAMVEAALVQLEPLMAEHGMFLDENKHD